MFSLARVFALTAVCFVAAACSKATDTPVPTTPPAAGPSVGTQVAPVLETTQLEFLTTNQIVKTGKNSLKLSGEGKDRTYRAIYKFNSSNNLTFKIFSIRQVYQCVGQGSVGTVTPILSRPTLNGPIDKQAVAIGDAIVIEPNTDYELTFTAEKTGCERLELSFDVTAWAGPVRGVGFTTKPGVARVCQSVGLGPAMTFFMGEYPPRTYASVFASSPLFASSDVYCGEDITSSRQECRISFVDGAEVSDCESATTPVSRMKVQFDMPKKSASVVCTKGGTETYRGAFRACVEKVLDQKAFEQP